MRNEKCLVERAIIIVPLRRGDEVRKKKVVSKNNFFYKTPYTSTGLMSQPTSQRTDRSPSLTPASSK